MLEKGYGASIIGKAHIKLKKPNQDSYLIANEDEYTLAVVCDGLGSKKYSQIGSKKLCKVIKKQINKCFQKKNLELDKLIPLLQRKWKRVIWPIKPIKADTTCIFTVISEKNIIMCQVGDGLCAMKKGDQLTVLSPKNDDFSNETMTFSKSKLYNWNTSIIKKEEGFEYKLILCTDGISEDLKIEVLGEFIDELASSISVESKTTNNQFLVEIINSWPNKYSNDDKTMVVIK